MKISKEFDKRTGKRVTIYEYNADDEEPDCGRCVHVCDSQDICNKCASGWMNYKRIEVEGDEDGIS